MNILIGEDPEMLKNKKEGNKQAEIIVKLAYLLTKNSYQCVINCL